MNLDQVPQALLLKLLCEPVCCMPDSGQFVLWANLGKY